MIKQKLVILSLGATVSLFGLSDAAEASTFGYSLSINDPIFNPASGVNNVPDFRLENISTLSEGIQIADFNLTIGDLSFNYDFVASQSVFSDSGDVLSFSPTAPDLINDGVGADEIDYDFTGFDPGDIFQFEADVDPDTASIVQDYRQILFPDAVLTVGFSNGETLAQTLNPADTGLDSYVFTQTAHLQRTTPEPATILGLGSLVCLGLGDAVRRRKRSVQ